jgi:methylmalonyl-CoA mutase cobalamin-binding subunit
MKFSIFQQKVQKILDVELPSGAAIVNNGRSIARDIRIGRTAFMDQMGVDSEVEYKRQCMRHKKIMFHAHIGMNTWQATAEALTFIFNMADKIGFSIDRAGICLDRRMALPQEWRKKMPPETGPTLESAEDWMQVGQIVPIQPHMGDFMIGFPASTENTLNALSAGVTTIGNLSQFFSHEVPLWRDQVKTAVETVRAISIMSALRKKGTLIHSYLEDGFGALFYDCATVAGWAYLERYIVEDLLGGKLAHCIGGLTTDPVKRAGWVFALNEIHEGDCLGSMFYGNTLSFTEDLIVNRALVGEYLIWDMIAQLECPTGHAVVPLPVTEAFRVASAEEIADAQNFAHRILETAHRLMPHMNFGASYDFCQKVVSAGKSVFKKALDGFKAAGVDIHDPIQMLYLLKHLGPAVFEEMFGAGEIDQTHIRGRDPVVTTDVFEMSNRCINENRHIFLQPTIKNRLKDHSMLIASTDVHEHAILVIHQLLSEAGVEMINLGAEKDPEKVASEACKHKVDAILISTHNGMALEYARRLKTELQKYKATIPVVMGGILNQKFEDKVLPVDVTDNLKEIGVYACARLEGKFRKMLEFNKLKSYKGWHE